jgi:hypothetical protein
MSNDNNNLENVMQRQPRPAVAHEAGMMLVAGARPAESAADGSNNETQRKFPRASLNHTRQCLTWSRVATACADSSRAPPPRSGAASVVVKGRLYVFGGYGGGTGRLDDFWSYHFETGIWEEVQVLSAEKPGCRENNGVVISDSSRSIYLFGGYNGKYSQTSRGWTFCAVVSDRRLS